MASLNRVKDLLKRGVDDVRTKELSGIKIAATDSSGTPVAGGVEVQAEVTGL